jgi:di/tripeptidase
MLYVQNLLVQFFVIKFIGLIMTPKQEKFCMKYIETGNASEAYRQAYNAENMKEESIKVNACKLLKDANIALTIDKLKAEHAERHDITVDSLTKKLEWIWEHSTKVPVPDLSNAMNSVMNQAKLHGLITDKQKIQIEGNLMDIHNERNRQRKAEG